MAVPNVVNQTTENIWIEGYPVINSKYIKISDDPSGADRLGQKLEAKVRHLNTKDETISIIFL